MVLACSKLKQIEVGLWWLAHYTSGQSCKALPAAKLALQLCRKEFPQRLKGVKQIKCLLGGKRVRYVWKDTHFGLHSGGSFKHVHGAFLLGFLLKTQKNGFNHSYLSGSESIFGISQDPSVYAHTSLSQDEFS